MRSRDAPAQPGLGSGTQVATQAAERNEQGDSVKVIRPTLWVNAGLGVLALAGALWAFQTVTVANTTSTSSTGQRVVAASVGNVVATVSASGTVQSASTANADFVTAGTVTEVDVKVGDTVAKGQVLAKVDPAAAQDTLNTAQANLTSARQALTRAKAATPTDAATISAA